MANTPGNNSNVDIVLRLVDHFSSNAGKAMQTMKGFGLVTAKARRELEQLNQVMRKVSQSLPKGEPFFGPGSRTATEYERLVKAERERWEIMSNIDRQLVRQPARGSAGKRTGYKWSRHRMGLLNPEVIKQVVDYVAPKKDLLWNHFFNMEEMSYVGLNLALVPKKYWGMLKRAATETKLPLPWIAAIAHTESKWNPKAVSNQKAAGLMQLMPLTAGEVDVKASHDPYQSLLGGATYLKKMLNKFKGNLEEALQAYNAGPTMMTDPTIRDRKGWWKSGERAWWMSGDVYDTKFKKMSKPFDPKKDVFLRDQTWQYGLINFIKMGRLDLAKQFLTEMGSEPDRRLLTIIKTRGRNLKKYFWGVEHLQKYIPGLPAHMLNRRSNLRTTGPWAALPETKGRMVSFGGISQERLDLYRIALAAQQNQNRLYREAAELMTDGPARCNLLVQQGTTLLQKKGEIAKYFITTQVNDQDRQQAYIQAINQGLLEQQNILRANAHIEDMRLRVVRENFAASYQAQMDQLKLKLKDTTFSEGLAIGFRKVGRDMETFAQMGSRIGQLTARTMSTSFETFFFDIMEGRVKRLEDYFKSFFASVGQALMRMMAQRTAQFLVSSVTSLFAAEKGGILPGSFLPVRKLQAGGVIRRPTLGLIGEGSRHEAVVPLPDNRHIPVLFTGQEQAVIQQAPPVINFVVNNQTGVPLQVKQAQPLTRQGPGLYQQVVNISIHAAAMNPSYRRAHGI